MADDKKKKGNDEECTCEDTGKAECPVHGKDAKSGKKKESSNPLAMWAKGRE